MKSMRVPGDKSISHRSLILAAIASGKSEIRGLLDSADVRSTASVLRAMGFDGSNGLGLTGLKAPANTLDCGNSGTTTRLMMGVCSAQSFTARFDGDDSLRSRPMRRVTEPLAKMGASFHELGEPGKLPIEVKGGRLHSTVCENPKSSAQVKSAVLLAALCGGVEASVIEPVHSRDHTERMLDALGVPLRTIADAQRGTQIDISPVDKIDALDVDVPGDFSSAAFLLARGLLGAHVSVENVGVNSTRTGFLDVVRRMQGTIHIEDRRTSCNEPLATLLAEPSSLKSTHIDGPEIPHLVDEIPILAVLAARADGETIIRGAAELRVKETDRIKAVVDNLTAIGAIAVETDDGMIIEGSDRPLKGRIKTFGDHRIAMAFGVLGSLKGNEIDIDDVACVDVSFPNFWNVLRGVAE